MRLKELINPIYESVFIMKTGYNPKGAKIFKNPTKQQVLTAFENHTNRVIEEYKNKGIDLTDPMVKYRLENDMFLKGMIIGNDIFLWSSMDGTHDGIFGFLEKNAYIDPDEANNDDPAFVLKLKNNKIIPQSLIDLPYRFKQTQKDQLLKKWITKWS